MVRESFWEERECVQSRKYVYVYVGVTDVPTSLMCVLHVLSDGG